MNSVKQSEKNSEIVISTTLYRALCLLKELQKSPLNLQEIKQLFINNEILNSKVSDDTVRITLSTLKSVGCVFSKPSIKNNFRYELLKSPFNYFLKDEEIDFLKSTREQIAQYIPWQKLLQINDLYSSINSIMIDNEKQFELSEKSIFQEINLEILKQLTKLCEQKIYISILYSSRNLLKNINFVPIFMKYENESVYVWGYNEEHQDYSYLNVKRIKKINSVLPEKDLPKFATYKAILKIKKHLFDYLNIDYKVKILENSDDYFKVEVEYLSEFHFLQKILEMSSDVEIIEPNYIKEKLIEKLKLMMELYK